MTIRDRGKPIEKEFGFIKLLSSKEINRKKKRLIAATKRGFYIKKK